MEPHPAGYVCAQVYSPNLPPALALPTSVPPYAPVSQPLVQFTLQGSLPLASCGVALSPAPVPVPIGLTTASEPTGHATATTTSEERSATPRPAMEKAKNEEVSSAPPSSRAAHAGQWEAPCLSPKGPCGLSCVCMPLTRVSSPQYMKKLHMQERAVEEVKLAIKPFYQKREVTKEEYKDILRKAVQKVGG